MVWVMNESIKETFSILLFAKIEHLYLDLVHSNNIISAADDFR